MDTPVLPAAPGADALRDEASSLRLRADAGTDQLQADRAAEMARRAQQHVGDESALKSASAGLGDVHRENVPTPKADIGPMLDPKETQNFAFALLGMSLIGAASGRGHFDMAMASMDGLLKGMKEGAEDNFKQRREEFDREFKLAIEKQRQADRVYEDLLKSKKLSLNAVAEQVRIHAAANKDWDMEAKARAHDFQGMYDRMYKNLQAADRLEAQGKKFTMDLDKFAEQKRHNLATERRLAAKDNAGTGNQGLSEKYTTDPEYKKKVDFWAEFMKSGNSLPPRFAQSGAGKAMYSDIVSVVPTLGSGDSREMRAGQVELAGQKSQARALGTRTAAIEQAASEAREMAPIVRELSGKVDRTKYPDINAVLLAYDKKTGDVPVKQLGAAINSYINAYARAVNPTGAATVHDKEHAREVLSSADSDAQINGILDVLDREMTAAQHSPKNVKRSLHNEITGGGGPKAGAVEDGYRFKGGDPAKPESWERVQ